MNPPNLFQKLAIAGVAGITATTIATAPAQAASGRLGFSDNNSDFFFNPVAGVVGTPVPNFGVDFVTSAGLNVAVLNAMGDFAPLFTPIVVTDSTQPSGTFINGEIIAISPVTGLPEYEFELQSSLTFTLDSTDSPGDTATYTLGSGSLFLGEYVVNIDTGNVEALEFELEVDASSSELCINTDCTPLTANSFEFEDLPGAGGGEFLADARSVVDTPEPASMLGILAVGGLALATRRKQAQK